MAAASYSSSYDLSESGSEGGFSSGSPAPGSTRQQRTPAASPTVARIGPGSRNAVGDSSAAATTTTPTRKRVPLNDEQRRERRRRANRESARRMRQKKTEMLSELQATLTNALGRAQALATDNARLRDLLRRNGIDAPPPPPAAATAAPRFSGAAMPAALEAQHSTAAAAAAAAVAAAATGSGAVAPVGGTPAAVAYSEPPAVGPCHELPTPSPAAAATVPARTVPPAPSAAPQGLAADPKQPPPAAAAPTEAVPGSQAAPAPPLNGGAVAAMSRLAQHGALAAAAFSLAPWPHNAPGGLPPPSFAPSAAPSVTAPLTVTGGRSPHRPCMSTSSVHLSSTSWLGAAGPGDGAPSVAAAAAPGLPGPPRPRRRRAGEPPSPAGQGTRPAKRAWSPPSMSLSLSAHAGSSGGPPAPAPGAGAAPAASLSLRPAGPAAAVVPAAAASAASAPAACPASFALSRAAPPGPVVPRSPSPALGAAGPVGGQGMSNPSSWPNLELLAAFGGPDAAPAGGPDALPALGPGPCWEDDLPLSPDAPAGAGGDGADDEMELGAEEEGLLRALISEDHLAASPPPPPRPARQAFQPWPFAAGDAAGPRVRAEPPSCSAPAAGASGFGAPYSPAVQQTQLQPRYALPPALPSHANPHQAAWCRWAGAAPAPAGLAGPGGGPAAGVGARTLEDAWAAAQAGGPAQGAALLHPMAFSSGGGAPLGAPALVISQQLQFQAHPAAAGHWPVAGAALEQHWQGWAQPARGAFAPAGGAPQGRPPGPAF